MSKIYDEQESPHEGFKIYDELVSFKGGGGAFKINDEPESANEGACLRYMMNRNPHMKGV